MGMNSIIENFHPHQNCFASIPSLSLGQHLAADDQLMISGVGRGGAAGWGLEQYFKSGGPAPPFPAILYISHA